MSHILGRGRTTPHTERDRWSWVVGALLVAAVGVVLGLQYLVPDKRMLAVLAAIVVVGVAWRLDLVSGIGLLIVALPYPRATVFGSTNFAFILLLVVLWLLRVSQGLAERPRPSLLDRPLIALVIAFVVSFYNLDRPSYLPYALSNFAVLVAGVAIYYLIVNNVRTDRALSRLHDFQLLTITTVCLMAVWELNNPGGVLIPGWIDFRGTVGEALNTRGIRVGGPFFDFELLSEFCAISLILVLFRFMRAGDTTRRVLLGGLVVLVTFIQFATVTRGGIIALVAGLGYLVWVLRHHLKFVPLVMAGSAAVVLFLLMNFYVANFTASGDLLARLLDPQTMEFQGGLPLNRADLWRNAWERMMQHPLLGHGPYYALQRGTTFWYWPHNGYLYIGNLVGLVGLSIYLWLLFTLWRITSPGRSNPNDPSYAQAFLGIARVQLFVFLLDQLKIDFMRNQIYTIQVFVMFGMWTAAAQIAAHQRRAQAAAPPAT